MADSAVIITEGTGTNIDTRTEASNGNHRQVVVLGDPSTNAGVAPVDGTAGVKVNLGADNDVTLATLPDTAGGDVAGINSKLGGTLTVDASGHAVPITDNSGSITVDGSVTADTELTTADLDTGAGTDTRAVVGLVGAKSGGGVLIPGDATKGLAVDLSATGANTNKLLVTPDLPALAATSTKQSDGSQKTQVVDGSGNVIGATSNALDINIKSGNPTSITANAGTNLNTSALALDATLAGAIKAEDAASADGDKGIPAMAVRKATPANTSGTDGDYENLQMSAGRLWVDASGKTLTVDASGAAVPVTDNSGSLTVDNGGTFAVQATPVTQADTFMLGGVNIKEINAVTPLMGNGAQGTGSLRVTVANDSTGKLATVDTITNVVHVDDNSGSLTVDGSVTITPSTAAGASVLNATSGDGSTALTNTAQAIKASAGVLLGGYIYNPNSTVAYVCVYNTASGSVTVGTTNPLVLYTIPAFTAVNLFLPERGIAFSTAISAAAASSAGGNGALTTALDANFYYL